MKVVTLVFYGADGAAAKAAAAKIRAETNGPALLRDARAFYGDADEPCARVVLMPDVSEYDAAKLRAAYGDRVAKAGMPLPPPPPPPPFDPLANLAPDWRKRDDLRQLAAAVSGGRSVENKAQAIAVIEAALKARK
jgi:hypothetical protein